MPCPVSGSIARRVECAAVNVDLERLVQLQKAASQLQRVEADLAQLPRDKAALEARLSEERARLDAARVGLQGSQKNRKQHETELQDLEQKRSKYKGQLMDVKTNKEYTAMLHEIEGVEREIRAREDLILGEMEKAESLNAEVKQEEQVFKTVEERFRDEGSALDSRARSLQAEAEQLRVERDTVAATLSPAVLDLYGRVARLRGVAVAEARDGTCQVCHVKLRPQMYVDLKKNEAIVQCPACNRILFFDPSAAAVPSQP
jgi:predicted  nucleic acid-binding Zn-ribbon protein